MRMRAGGGVCIGASLAVAAAAVMAFGSVSAAADDASPGHDVRRPKKLIAVGWDLFADTAWLLKHRDALESRPFQGIVINVVGRQGDGKQCQLRLAFSREPWRPEWFAQAIDDIKACRFSRLTDNFIMVWANPGDVDWFDDAGWREVIDHWRIAARVARQSGVRGLAFDPEPYYQPHEPFTYAAQPGRATHTFDQYAAKVRQRGREVMQAVAAEFSDAVLLTFFMNSICGSVTGQADPRPLLAARPYGLYPAFIDGWLDAAPATLTMVDGNEHAYRYNSDLEFLEAANQIRGACQELVSPANRAKYRAQVQVGFGIYLDAHINPPTSPWYIDPKGGSRVDRFRANVAAAVRAADEYVWIYGEKFRWWPTPNRSVDDRTWSEVLPGCEDALRWARDPLSAARWKVAELARAGALRNLLENGDFSASRPAAAGQAAATRKPPMPDKWGIWKHEKSGGTFAWDDQAGAATKGAARICGMDHGCFIQSVPVEPGRRFAVEAVRRIQGRGDASLVVRWQTADERWTAEPLDVHLVCTEPRTSWGRFFGAVQVPQGVGRLVVLLLVRGQASDDDVAWFDDAAVYAID